MLNAWETLKLKYKDKDIRLYGHMVSGTSGTAYVSFPPHTKHEAYVVTASGMPNRAEVLSKLAENAERVVHDRAEGQPLVVATIRIRSDE